MISDPLSRQLKGKSVWAVAWDDAHSNAGDVDFENLQHAPWQFVTVGVLLQDDEVGISLAQDVGEDGAYRGTTFIPAQMVRAKWKLRTLPPPRKVVGQEP